MQYAENEKINVCAEFLDDGESGTKWERSGLQSMLSAIEEGFITTILVKDLSRLSRDYIRTGILLEQWFPEHHVRFIAVDDGIDSKKTGFVDHFSPLRAVMDDWYARDISQKVRAAIHARQKAGYCTAAILPYGYDKKQTEIGISEEKAIIVRKIYHLYQKGVSCQKIAEKLNKNQISSPRNAAGGWSDQTVRHILKNPAYTGHLQLHKTQKLSYKSTKKQILSQNEGVLFQVPAIIPVSQFRTVQDLLKKNGHTAGSKHWLSGKVECGLCGCRMIVTGSGYKQRMICGGRRRKNGCGNASVLVHTVMEQIAEALMHSGIQADLSILKRIVERITVSPEQITVFLSCQKPHTDEQVYSFGSGS